MLSEPLVPARARPQERLRNWLLGGILLIVTIGALSVAAPVVVPVFMAVFVATVLRAPVRGLMNIGVPQPISAVIVFLTFGATLFVVGLLVSDPASKWISELPRVMERVEDKLTPLRQTLKQATAAAQKIEAATEISPTSNARPVEIRQPSLLQRALHESRNLVIHIAMVTILAFFMLSNSHPVIPARFLASFGGSGRRLRSCLKQIETQISRYMGITTLTNICLGVLTGIAMYLCDMPNPILWAVVCMIFSFIPYLGPIVIATAIASAAFLNFETWPQIIAPVAAYMVLHITESEFITPVLVGRFMTVHPVAIFISVLTLGWMWGLAGAFLAVPVLVACAIIGRNLLITDRSSLSEVMFRLNWDMLMRGPRVPPHELEDAEPKLGTSE